MLWRRDRPLAALVDFAITVPLLAAVAAPPLWTWAVLVFACRAPAAPRPGRGSRRSETGVVAPGWPPASRRPGRRTSPAPASGSGWSSPCAAPRRGGPLGVVGRDRPPGSPAPPPRRGRPARGGARRAARRIAEDLRGLVAVRAERVVAGTRGLRSPRADAPDVGGEDSTATAAEARAALAGMRRALWLLRTEESPAPAPDPESPGRSGRRRAAAWSSPGSGRAGAVLALRRRPAPLARGRWPTWPCSTSTRAGPWASCRSWCNCSRWPGGAGPVAGARRGDRRFGAAAALGTTHLLAEAIWGDPRLRPGLGARSCLRGGGRPAPLACS